MLFLKNQIRETIKSERRLQFHKTLLFLALNVKNTILVSCLLTSVLCLSCGVNRQQVTFFDISLEEDCNNTLASNRILIPVELILKWNLDFLTMQIGNM